MNLASFSIRIDYFWAHENKFLVPYEAFKVNMIWSPKLPFDLFQLILMILMSTFQGVITFGFFFHWAMPLGKDYAFIWVYNTIKLNWTLWIKLGYLQTQVYNMLGNLKQDWKKYFKFKNKNKNWKQMIWYSTNFKYIFHSYASYFIWSMCDFGVMVFLGIQIVMSKLNGFIWDATM